MIVEFGHFCLILALSLGVTSWVISLTHKNPSFQLVSYTSYSQMVLLLISFLCIVNAFIRCDFSVKIVAEHSHETTPLIYRLAAVWGHHEGSMLLWCLLLSLYGIAFASNPQKIAFSLHHTALKILQQGLSLFIAYSVFFANPFERLMPFPINQGDLNPLLQDPSLTIHPIFLYLGFLGFSIPYALGVSMKTESSSQLAQGVKPWMGAASGFLALGIMTGSFWAYYELGWGGWWFWDPVESASLLPWLGAAAFFHFSRQQTTKSSSSLAFLSCLPFILCLLSTWVIRGGGLNSVHAFALSPERSLFLLALTFIAGGASLPLFKKSSILSVSSTKNIKDLLLKGGTLSLLFLLFVVLIGIFFPLAFEKITGHPLALGTEYFTKLFCYPALIMIGLMGCVPFFSTTSKKIMGISFLLIGMISYLFLPFPKGFLYMGTAFWLIGSTLISIVRMKVKDLLHQAPSWSTHLGVGILALGIGMNALEKKDNTLAISVGEKKSIGTFDIRLQKIRPIPHQNYLAYCGTFLLEKQGIPLETLHSERRVYFSNQQEHSEAAMYQRGVTTLSLILGETHDQNTWVVRFYKSPGLLFIWGGCFLIAVGFFCFILRRRGSC